MNYTYSVNVDPLFLISAPFIAALIFLWPRRKTIIDENSIVGRIRPIIALYIDMFFILILLAPLFAIPLAFEYIATGSWAWSVNRNFARPTDIIIIVEIALIFWAFHNYLKWIFGKGGQTIGQYFMQFQLSKTDATAKVGLLQYFAWALNNSFPKFGQLIFWKRLTVTKGIKIQKVKNRQK